MGLTSLLGEQTRAKVLGQNAARVFGFKEVPARYDAKA
jgi:predicted TIM-barrel fold metal-dependent hydrolase